MKRRKAKHRGLRLSLKVILHAFLVVGACCAYVGNGDGITVTTSLAERKTITLPDQTVLELNAMTSIVLQENAGRRKVVMAQGEVRASLNHGVSKPMDVVVNHLLLEDVGTQYDVLSHEGTTEVSVTAGQIRAYECRSDGTHTNPIAINKPRPGRDPAYLTAGDSARFQEHDGTILIAKNPNDLQSARERAGWVNGELDTKRQPLDLIVWELNRYNTVHIVVDDPELARIMIGGHYRLIGVDAFLSALHGLGLEAVLVRESDSGMDPTYLLRRMTDESRHASHR